MIEAETVFERLCSFAPYDAEREELRASGVAQATIERLYPVSDFGVLVPGLIEHFQSSAIIRLPSRIQWDEASGLIGHFSKGLERGAIWKRTVALIAAEAEGAPLAEFTEALRERLLHVEALDWTAKGRESEPQQMGKKIARMLWYSHWLYQQREQHGAPHTVDPLLIWTHEHILSALAADSLAATR